MPTASATCQAEDWRGQPAWRITLAEGDSVLIAEQGAQVLSWCSGGRERLFLSPFSVADGRTPIRGGVPVCWPQFNQAGALPKHGFARNLAWQQAGFVSGEELAEWRMRLVSDAQTLAFWPHRFELTLRVCLSPGRLHLALDVHNPGDADWSFTGALHSYLRVDDVTQVRLSGLQGQAEWDALRHQETHAPASIAMDGPFDRVYAAAPQPLRLIEGACELRLSQSASWAHTVVWNPGTAMPDLPDQTFRQMLCVEAAQAMSPLTVSAGGRWVGWQQFDVLCG